MSSTFSLAREAQSFITANPSHPATPRLRQALQRLEDVQCAFSDRASLAYASEPLRQALRACAATQRRVQHTVRIFA